MKFFIFILLMLGLLAWCPWFKGEEAVKLIDEKVATVKNTVNNLCPIEVRENTLHKTFFGYSEKVTYDCTSVDQYNLAKSEEDVLATFYGSVIGVPIKTVKSY